MTRRRRSIIGPAITLWAGFLLILAGAAATVAAWCDMRWRAARAGWPTTTGRVTSAEVELGEGRDGTTYAPQVWYTYSVGGRSFTAGQLAFTGRGYEFNDQTSAQGVLARYVPGGAVTVHYDPRDPASAYAEAADTSSDYEGVVACGVLTGIGLVVSTIGGVRCRAVVRSRAATSLLNEPAVRRRFPLGREIAAADRRPAAEMTASVTAHSGAPLAANSNWFQRPPDEIGPVSSANCTLRRGKRLWTDAGRVTLVLAVFVACLAAGGALLWLFDPEGFAFVLVATFAVLIATTSPAVLFLTRFEHVLTYVGRDGLARYVMHDGAAGPVVEEILRFEHAVGLSRTEHRYFHKGRVRLAARLAWVGVGGRELMSLSQNSLEAPDRTLSDGRGDYDLGNAAAAAWAAHVAARGSTEYPASHPPAPR